MKRTLGLLFAALALAAEAFPVKPGNPGFPYSVPGSFLTVGKNVQGKYMFRAPAGKCLDRIDGRR